MGTGTTTGAAMFGFGSWERGTATVVARRLLKEWRTSTQSVHRGMRRRKFEFILDVLPDDGSDQFRATCVNASHDPVQGDQVPVLFKPRSRKVKFDSDRILGKDRRRPRPPRSPAEDARWERMKDGEFGEKPPPRDE